MNIDDSQAIDIKATKRTKVAKLITAYAQSKGVAESSLRLFLGSTRLNVESTLGEVQVLCGNVFECIRPN